MSIIASGKFSFLCAAGGRSCGLKIWPGARNEAICVIGIQAWTQGTDETSQVSRGFPLPKTPGYEAEMKRPLNAIPRSLPNPSIMPVAMATPPSVNYCCPRVLM